MHNPILIIAGTRPEIIKLSPVYWALKKIHVPTLLCATGQHTDLFTDALNIFGIIPDFNLAVMKKDQDLFFLTSTLLIKIRSILQQTKPELVVVQGDTTSAFIGALAAFYLKIPVAHIEAGLRTHNMQLPFPEEANRRFISIISQFNFTPTKQATQNLVHEGIAQETIYQTGNTIVDALFTIQEKITRKEIILSADIQKIVRMIKKKYCKFLVLTAHRRESFGTGLHNIFGGIKKALEQNKNLFCVYPVHPNPAIQQALKSVEFENLPNIRVIKPLAYTDMIYLLTNADFIATDSGGIQEEGVTLNKHVLVLRNETERPEGVEAGMAKLVGTNQDAIVQEITKLANTNLNTPTAKNIYGDGTAAAQIAQIIKNFMLSPN